jgi:hypothetical protein
VINPKDLESEINLGNGHLVINGIDVNGINTELLNKHLVEYGEVKEEFDHNTTEDMEQFFNQLGYYDVEIRYSDDTLPADDVLMYDTHNNEFYNLKYGYEIELYRWMKGTNVEVIYGEEIIETSLVISEKSVNLDEWDGNNYSTGSKFEHEEVHKIFEINGKKVENQFLLVHWSQWQGTHPEGRIMTLEEIIEHLKELGYDTERYMILIEEIPSEF